MRTEVYTKIEAFDLIEHATANLLLAAGELSRFPWNATSSGIVDMALSIEEKLGELRALEEAEALPSNVVRFPGAA